MACHVAWRMTLITSMSFALTGLAGCSSNPAPLTSSDPGPLATLSSGGQVLVNGGGIPVVPGQAADFTVYVVNPADSHVELVSAALVPVPGYPEARFLHVGLMLRPDVLGAGRGWPSGIPTRPLTGARLPRGQSNIIIGITGQAAGRNYAAAGIRISYRVSGRLYHLTAWSVGVACVRKVVGPSYPGCSAAVSKAVAAVRKMIGLPG
jgi:hypothetical protein